MNDSNLNRYTFWLFCFAAIVIFAGIGLRDPWPPDEPRFALMAKEMWDTGQWFFPHRGGEIYPDKPPMVMWMIFLFYALLHNLKIAFLLPSALLSLATLWMTYDIARRLWNKRIGLYAGYLLAISLHFILQAKSGQLDAPVAFWVMLGCYGLLRHLILGPSWKWYYLAFFAMGMGIITKGVGFLPVLMLLALLKYPPLWLDKKNKYWGKWFLAIVFLLLAVSLWLLPMLIQVAQHPTVENLGYRDNILLKQTVNRYAKSWAHIQPFYYYILEVIPLFWLPLTLFIPWLVRPIIHAFKKNERRIIYPLIMLSLSIFFFSLSKGKRAEYMLPVLPMFVLLIAPYFEQLMVNKNTQRLVFLLVVFITFSFSVVGLAGLFGHEKLNALTQRYAVNLWYWLSTIGLVGLFLSLLLRKRAMTLYTVFICLLWLSYSFWAMPLVDKAMSSEPMMKAIAQKIPNNAELGIVGMREKLLLHSQWQTTHFGHHIAKAEQQLAAIIWLNEKPNRYVLVNRDYLNDCFLEGKSIQYDSIHVKKWLLFSKSLVNCQTDKRKYQSFIPK